MTVARRLEELGLVLPRPSAPVANYVPAVRTGNLLFISAHIPRRDGSVVSGKVGRDLDRAEAAALAREVALDLLATAQSALGDLESVRRVVKLFGMVNSTGDFTEQSAVIDGASALLVDVFGERGKHARAAVGVAQLPLGAAIEIEMVLELDA